MHTATAYERRWSLSDRELERLEGELCAEVSRYQDAIKNYPPDRMRDHGQPFLERLQARVAYVRSIMAERLPPTTPS